MSRITEFVENALLDNSNIHFEFSLGFIPNHYGQRIASATGIHSIAGAEKILTAHAVRHAFIRHKSKKTENERGQIGIEIADFEYLSDIISNATIIERGDIQNRKNNEIIKMSKTIKGHTYYVILSISNSKNGKRLIFNTMYIKK